MKEKLSLGGNNKKEKPITKQMAEVGIGAGLITLGPGIIKGLSNETSSALGIDLNSLPKSEALSHFVGSGVETIQGLTGIGVTSMLMYIGAKEMLKPLFEK